MLERVRGLVRPALTVMGFTVLSVLVLRSVVEVKEYIILVTSMVTYWFATRTHNGSSPPP